MPGGSLPVPNDILALAEDYNAALKDVERNIRSVERDIVKTLKKEGDIDALMVKKRELEATRSTISAGQQEQAFNKRVEKILERRGSRVASQFRGTAVQSDQLNSMVNLARGNFSASNLVQSARGLASGGRGFGGAAAASFGQQLGLPAGVGLAAGAVIAPLAAVYMDIQAQEARNAEIFKGYLQILKAGKKLGLSKEETNALRRRQDVGRVGGSFGERLKLTNKATLKRISEVDKMTGNEQQMAMVAALYNSMRPGGDRFGMDTSSPIGIKELLLQLDNDDNGGRSRGVGMEQLVDAYNKQVAREEEQTKYFSTNPSKQREFHESQRQFKFTETERQFKGVKAW